jgi:hypothetical protein
MLLFWATIFTKISEKIAHNVPAVYDVFVGRISKPQVCSPAKMWVEGGVGMSEAIDLADRNPGATEGSGAYTVLLGAVKSATKRHNMDVVALFNQTLYVPKSMYFQEHRFLFLYGLNHILS